MDLKPNVGCGVNWGWWGGGEICREREKVSENQIGKGFEWGQQRKWCKTISEWRHSKDTTSRSNVWLLYLQFSAIVGYITLGRERERVGFGGSRTVANPNLNGWGWWCLVTAFLQPTGPIQCACCVREYACTPSTQLVKAGADKSAVFSFSRQRSRCCNPSQIAAWRHQYLCTHNIDGAFVGWVWMFIFDTHHERYIEAIKRTWLYLAKILPTNTFSVAGV